MVAMHYAARHLNGVSRLILPHHSPVPSDETVKMMHRLGGDEAAQVARQFFSNPSEDAYETYGKVCRRSTATRMHHRQEISAIGPFSARSAVHFFTDEMRHMDMRAEIAVLHVRPLLLAERLILSHRPPAVSMIAAAIGDNAVLHMFREGHGPHRQS